MAFNHVNDSKHWRDRAAEMRALSDLMKDHEAMCIMLRLADDYDVMADRADVRSNGNVPIIKAAIVNWSKDPAERLRQKAEEARVIGEDMRGADTKRTMLEIASDYETMAAAVDRKRA